MRRMIASRSRPLLKVSVFFLILLIMVSHQPVHSQSISRIQFPDLLPVQLSITDTNEVANSFFSDMGAWHAYGLPGKPADYGGFTGPLLMDMEGKWLAESLGKLSLKADGQPVDWSKSTAELHYYPGLLDAVYRTGDWELHQQLIFTTGREARIHSVVRNLSPVKKKAAVSFSGTILSGHPVWVVTGTGFTLWPEKTGKFLRVAFEQTPRKLEVKGRSYVARFMERTLAPGDSIVLDQSQAWFPEGVQERELKSVWKHVSFGSFSMQLEENEKRWNGYLERGLAGISAKGEPVGLSQAEARRIGARAIVTLLTNWRSACRDLLHDGVFPSASYQGFYGVWSWDSWKQAVALALFDTALAENNIRCLFDYQDSVGMVPDCVYADKRENNLRDTKPPLAAWAVSHVFAQSGDRAFVREMYPKLVRYHRWWYIYRDHDRNGLCEFGSTDGTRIAAAWESGMDNAVRFDSARMIAGPVPGAWSLNQESVDLNAYLYAEKLFLAQLAEALGKQEEAGAWKTEAAVLKEKIGQRFFSKERGYYYDYHTGLKKLIGIDGPEGWIPLWAGIPDAGQAAGVSSVMQDTARFHTYLPLPTLAANHPAFNPANGYWRGPVWVDQFYYGVEGLRRYGYVSQAEELTGLFFRHAEGIRGDAPFRENYHPLTGKGLNAVNFSWTAAFVLLMLRGGQ